MFSFGIFGIETVTYAVVFWNTLILWNFVIFGAEPLLNVLKTTTKGRSLGGGTIYIYIYTSLSLSLFLFLTRSSLWRGLRRAHVCATKLRI